MLLLDILEQQSSFLNHNRLLHDLLTQQSTIPTGRQVHIGTFSTDLEAAHAYDIASIQLRSVSLELLYGLHELTPLQNLVGCQLTHVESCARFGGDFRSCAHETGCLFLRVALNHS